MSNDFDWLECLSLLSPKCSLSSAGFGGVPRITREDVVGALAGVSGIASMLVFNRTGMLPVYQLVRGTVDEAFVTAIRLARDDVCRYSLDDFFIVWSVALQEDAGGNACPSCRGTARKDAGGCSACSGSGVVRHSVLSRADAAGVSRSKWSRLQVLHPVCAHIVADCWDEVRCALRSGLLSRADSTVPMGGVGGVKSLQAFPI